MTHTPHEPVRVTRTAAPPALSSAGAVRLVAGRELQTRWHSKAYRITTLALVILVVGFALAMKVIASQDNTQHVGVAAGAQTLMPGLRASAAALGHDLVITPVPDEAAGRAAVRDGDLDALVLGLQGSQLAVIVDKELDPALRTVLTAAAGQSVLEEQISRLGGDPANIATEVSRTTVAVTPLQPAPTFDPQRLVIGSVAGVLIYLALMFTGQSIAQGVVEEKSSRVVELLLSTIRPWELMAGKALGIGLIGLLQVALVGGAGVITGQLSGSLTISLGTSVSALVWLIVWFILGFTLYSLVFAGLAALVSRQEDVGGVIAPALMFLVLGYVVGISVLPSVPDSSVVAVLSLLPMFSPTLMPMRLAMGAVPLWQILLSVGLVLIMIPLLVALAGRIYRNAVMRTGSRVSLREAVRAT